jgi:hypothetical protein
LPFGNGGGRLRDGGAIGPVRHRYRDRPQQRHLGVFARANSALSDNAISHANFGRDSSRGQRR